VGPPGGLLLFAAGLGSLILGLGLVSRHFALAGARRDAALARRGAALARREVSLRETCASHDRFTASRGFSLREWGSLGGRVLLSSPFLAGVGATFLLQSSSASLIGLLGLVRAGYLPLPFAFRFVLGANVGTTFVVQALAFDPGWELAGGLLLLAGGVRILRRGERYALLFAGVGLAFLGLELLEVGAKHLFTAPVLEQALRSALHPPGRAWLMGVFMSALASSSAATIALLGRLAQAGEVGLQEALPLLLGQDLGTTADVLLASLVLGGLARTVGLFHLGFNLCLSAFFLPLIPHLVPLLTGLSPHPARQLAHAHTLFNLLGSGVALGLLAMAERRKG